MEYHELEHMTVVKLREEAKKFDDVKGATGMKKEELVALLAEKYGLEKPEHKPKKKKAKGKMLDKDHIKAKIVELKALRDEARTKNNHKQTATLRRRIHQLKRRMRKIV
jgi:hypothetical protein